MMSEAIEKQRNEILYKFVQKDIKQKIGVKTENKESSHYFGKTTNSTHKDRKGSLHLTHRITNICLCNPRLKIVEKVDLFSSDLPVCKMCLRIYDNFRSDKHE